jgi:hypothetical protein
MKTRPQRFVLTLQLNEDETDPDGYRRLRLALKRLLRCWGLRCTKIDFPDSAHQPPGLPPQNESTNPDKFEPLDG